MQLHIIGDSKIGGLNISSYIRISRMWFFTMVWSKDMIVHLLLSVRRLLKCKNQRPCACMYVALWTIMDKPEIDPWLIFLDFQKKFYNSFDTTNSEKKRIQFLHQFQNRTFCIEISRLCKVCKKFQSRGVCDWVMQSTQQQQLRTTLRGQSEWWNELSTKDLCKNPTH